MIIDFRKFEVIISIFSLLLYLLNLSLSYFKNVANLKILAVIFNNKMGNITV